VSCQPPSLVPKRVDSEMSGAIGVRWAARARAKRGQCWMTCAAVCGLTPHSGQLVDLRGWKRAVYSPMKAWPMMRRTRVALAWQELYCWGEFPRGGIGEGEVDAGAPISIVPPRLPSRKGEFFGRRLLRWSWARQAADTSEPRSASKAVAVVTFLGLAGEGSGNGHLVIFTIVVGFIPPWASVIGWPGVSASPAKPSSSWTF
jgi:hypothetical protein